MKAADIIKLQPVKGVREPTSVDECKLRLEKAIKSKDLQKFYPEVTQELAERAANLVNQLREKKQCSWEMANQFSTLALYDLAILIGMNLSPNYFWD